MREIWLRRTRNSAACTKPVGAGLLANAVGQAKVMAQADRLREQAHSYSGSVSKQEDAAVRISVAANAKSSGLRKSCRSVACPAIGCAAVVKPCGAMLADTPHSPYCCRCAPDRGTSHAPTVDRRRTTNIAAVCISCLRRTQHPRPAQSPWEPACWRMRWVNTCSGGVQRWLGMLQTVPNKAPGAGGPAHADVQQALSGAGVSW